MTTRMTWGPTTGPSPTPTPLSVMGPLATAALMKYWSSTEVDPSKWWLSLAAQRRKIELWWSGKGAGRRIWGRRMNASMGLGSEKGSVN
ncbi:hypothetical protein HU200_010890 [Digitaria exilis]|uniref:Uncharacterized protein n=1 Tax=Digitaria exilis TaxID=1010633 RepID=A0A835KLS7_9POAL|nr:hypothetical protein HU200_010890 [Digitaria exilis]